MVQKAVEHVMNMEKNKLDKEVATSLKKEFDTVFHPTWQCIVGKHVRMNRVGKNFGSEIGHEEKHMIYFFWGNTAILLWKAG